MDEDSRAGLNNNELWYRALFELSPDPTWIIEDNRFVECNDAAVRTLGYASHDELLNLHPSKLSPPRQADGEDSFAKAERMMAIARSKGGHRFEWLHSKADGTDLVAEVTLSNIELADRKIIYCVWRDLTESKAEAEDLLRSEAQQALLTGEIQRRSEALEHSVEALANTRNELEAILRNAWIGVVQVSKDRIILRTNRHFEQDIFGYEESEMQGKFSSILYPSQEAYEEVGRNAYPSLVEGKPYSMLECPCRRKDGTIFLAQLVGSLIDPNDFSKGSIWLFNDITERKAAEERLSQTLSELEIIFQNPSVGIIYTVDRRIIRANKTFEAMFNLSSEQFIGQNTRFIYESDEAYEAAGQKIHSAFAAGENCRYDIVAPGRDGSRRTYELFGSIVDDNDLQKRSIWLFSDVTDIRDAQNKLREAKAATERAAEAIREKSEQIASLLDNSGQGFLSFGSDLIIEPAYSRACEAMLGRSLAGRRAADVFFPHDTAKGELFCSTISSALAEPDVSIRESMLSLLPAEIIRAEVLLKVEYKPLDNGKFMVVLTDITAERLMAAMLRTEQHRQEMIVRAVSDSRSFFDAIDGFRKFLSLDLPGLLDGAAAPSIKELYREIHTYKGLLNQFSFPSTPAALHDIESNLSDALSLGDRLTAQRVADLISLEALQSLFQRDIAILSDALGEEFLAQGESVTLSVDQARQLEVLATQLLRGEPIDTTDPELHRLLAEVSTMGMVSFGDALKGFDGLMEQVAARLEKKVAPIIVNGDAEIWIDPDAYRPFLRSLAHVFRNAVTHGIETPEARWEAGKEEAGKIICRLAIERNNIKLSITDDGCGIDIEALRQRTVAAGIYDSDEVLSIPEHEIARQIFMDNISTQLEVSELAGRGVGLAAVMRETVDLGGELTVETVAGEGTSFLFTLPKIPAAQAGRNK